MSVVRKSFRPVALVLSLIALTTIAITAASPTRFAFIDQIQEYFAPASTTPQSTTAPKRLRNIGNPSLFAPKGGSFFINIGTGIAETFAGLGTTATATLPSDWKVDKITSGTSGIRTVGSYTVATAATEQVSGGGANPTTGGIYNWGAGTTTTGSDRALGFLGGTSLVNGNIYVKLTNNTGSAVSGVEVSYDVEKYRNGTNAAGFSIQMHYGTTGTSWTSGGSNFLTSFAGADANNSGFTTAPGTTTSVTNKVITQSVANGSDAYLAWNYAVTSGTTVTNAQGIGIDNVTITPQFTLTVDNAGGGSVTSNTGGINCPGTCSANFNHGTSVILTANPAIGYTFQSWSGTAGCTGNGTCPVTMDAAKNAIATFTAITAPDAPTIESSDPISPGQDPTPDITGAAQALSTVKLFRTAGCTNEIGSGAADAFGDYTITATVLDNQLTTIYANAANGGGTSTCTGPFNYVHDTSPPAVLISIANPSTPASPNASTNPSMNGSADEGSTVRIYLNPTGDCSGALKGTGTSGIGTGTFSIPITVLANAATTVGAKATDAAGNESGCSNSFTYYSYAKPTVASVAPNSGPDSGGTPIVITGTNFAIGEATIQIAGNACAVTNPDPTGDPNSSEKLHCTTPLHLPGTVDVVVFTPGGNSTPVMPTTADDFTYFTPTSELALTKSDGGVSVRPDDLVSYTLGYSNNGNTTAAGVVITETVPADTTFNGGASTAGWDCGPGSAGSTCTFALGSVTAGGSGSVTFAVTLASPIQDGVTEISNSASIADDNTNGADTEPLNNTAEDSTPITVPPSWLVVTKTSDAGDGICSPEGTGDGCSLREAIDAANSITDENTITFEIATGSAPWTIEPLSALPTIESPVTIDGGGTPATMANPAVIVIQIDGSNAGAADVNGLTVNVPSVIQGLAISNFSGNGIVLMSGAGGTDPFTDPGSEIIGNFIGTDAGGTLDLGNDKAGVLVDGSSYHMIGCLEVEERNVISGNGGAGVQIVNSASNNAVQGNFIGVGADGMTALPNAGSGVEIGTPVAGPRPSESSMPVLPVGPTSQFNMIGAPPFEVLEQSAVERSSKHNHARKSAQAEAVPALADGANIIANNGGDGVTISDPEAVKNPIVQNSIYSNIGLGIDLYGIDGVDGVTANDSPDDVDTGANNLQNFPVIESADPDTQTVTGYVEADMSAGPFIVELFKNNTCDTVDGNGEGMTSIYFGPLDNVSAPRPEGGLMTENINIQLDPGTIGDDDVITATVTDANGNTSEFSACFAAVSVANPGSIQFSSATYSDNETNDGHTFDITVTRTGGSDGEVSVNYSVTDGTADAIDDYSFAASPQTLTWADGDDQPKIITVNIVGDTAFEPDEFIEITLSGQTGGATLGTPFETVLTILNDDCVNNPKVTTLADSGEGSLREAIAAACTGSTIRFELPNGGPHTIPVGSALTIPSKTLTITGPEGVQITLDGGSVVVGDRPAEGEQPEPHPVMILEGPAIQRLSAGQRAPEVTPLVTISNLGFTGGANPNGCGGGIVNDHGNLALNRVTIYGNTAGTGAGVCNLSAEGGAAQLSIVNSTIHGNTATGQAGGIRNDGQFDGNAELTVINSTISANSAMGAGGIYNTGLSDGRGVVTLKNTILANAGPNVANLDNADDASGDATITSEGFNLADDSGNSHLNHATDQLSTDPMLGQLQDNGGSTLTRAPQGGSPAIDKGGEGVAIDQRGLGRPADFVGISNADGGNGSDIGAFEVQVTTAGEVSISGRVTTAGGRGVSNATIRVSGGSLAAPLSVMTGRGGSFTVPGLESGRTYVVTVSSRRFTFSEPSRVVDLRDNATGVDFTADP